MKFRNISENLNYFNYEYLLYMIEQSIGEDDGQLQYFNSTFTTTDEMTGAAPAKPTSSSSTAKYQDQPVKVYD